MRLLSIFSDYKGAFDGSGTIDTSVTPIYTPLNVSIIFKMIGVASRRTCRGLLSGVFSHGDFFGWKNGLNVNSFMMLTSLNLYFSI